MKNLTKIAFCNPALFAIGFYLVYLLCSLIPHSFPVSILQLLVGTLTSIVGLLAITKFCMYLFLRKLYDYIYGHKCRPDPAKEAGPNNPPNAYFSQSFHDFKGLQQKWIKFLIAFFFFALFLVVALSIFHKLLSVSSIGEIYISN